MPQYLSCQLVRMQACARKVRAPRKETCAGTRTSPQLFDSGYPFNVVVRGAGRDNFSQLHNGCVHAAQAYQHRDIPRAKLKGSSLEGEGGRVPVSILIGSPSICIPTAASGVPRGLTSCWEHLSCEVYGFRVSAIQATTFNYQHIFFWQAPRNSYLGLQIKNLRNSWFWC